MNEMRVEWGKIREFAIATGSRHPSYLDDEHAPIPPTFLVTSIIWDRKDERPDHDPEREKALAEVGIVHDLKGFLSGQHDYVFHAPLIRAGERLIMADRFDGLEQRTGRRGGAMTLVRSTAEYRSPDGTLRAECRYTGIYVQAPPSDAADTPASNESATQASTSQPSAGGISSTTVDTTTSEGELPSRSFGPVTLLDNVRYQGASGDMNPIHHDDEYARSAGYERAFSVGMLGAGYLATFCTDQFGHDTVRRLRVRFSDLVWTGDTLTAHGRVVRHFDANGERRVELALAMVNQHGRVAVDGSAEFALNADGPTTSASTH
ncbi:MAG: MaoC family dehydratase N-terminal domain-containing protein [Acidimicrobiia bacterium]